MYTFKKTKENWQKNEKWQHFCIYKYIGKQVSIYSYYLHIYTFIWMKDMDTDMFLACWYIWNVHQRQIAPCWKHV